MDLMRRSRLCARNAYAHWLGPATSRFRRGAVAMFHVGRSGSSVLGGMLARHPQIFWDGEIFRSHLERHSLSEEAFDSTSLVGVDPPNLETLVARSGPLYYGLEVKFFHLDLFGIPMVDYLERLEHVGITHVIVLERRNYVAKVVSSVRAHLDGRYHIDGRVGAKAPLAPVDLTGDLAIDYSRQPLLGHLRGYEAGFRELRRALDILDFQVLELNYEDDIRADPSVAYRKACEHLDVRPVPIRPRLRRSGDADLRSQILQLDLVEQSLAATPFEWMVWE